MTDAKSQNSDKPESKEQNTSKKKPDGLTLRVFKWIGKGVLVLLLILALILQAPWKIITLLTIFFLACFFLPKPARKWFWLGVGAVVLILSIWVFLPEDDTGWRPYTFDEEHAALEAKYAIPDEENAAFVYDEIFETLDIDSNQPEFFLESKPSSQDEPWLSKDHPETEEWLKSHQATIEKLMETTQKDKCHFPISADSWDFGQNIKRLTPMRPCTFLLISAGNNDIGEGRKDAGLEKYLCILRMANHLYQQPTVIYFLLGSGLERLAFNQLNRFVIDSEPTEEQLKLIINASGDMENNWGPVLKKALETDKLITKNTFCSLSYEVNQEGKVRFSRNPNAVFEAAFPNEMSKPTYWQKKLYKAKTIFAWLGMPPTPQKAAEIFDDCFDIYYATTKPDFNWENQPQKFDSLFTKKHLYRIKLNFRYVARNIVYLSEGASFSLQNVHLKSLAMRRGSRLLIAITKYKSEHSNWPESLDDIKSLVPAEALIDPAGGKFDYENHGERFSLYGKSVNIWPQ